jgi:hypothetical protein
VSQFVEECRREWKRLRVPDPVANEMAADLTADLDEAEAEGVSAEEVLGIGVFDPRAFAASWAAERGVIQPAPGQERPPRRWLRIAIAALALITVGGAALALFASRPGPVAAIAPSRADRFPGPPALEVHGNFSSVDLHAIGLILLLVGLAGILSMLFWLSWAGRGHWSRPRAYVNEDSGSASY